MEAVRLRFSEQGRGDRPLPIGVHALGRGAQGGIDLLEGEAGPVRLCVDRRGMWLNVDDGAGGVHVNGREIRRMAMLRVGDAIYVDGTELRLVSARAARPADHLADTPSADDAPNLRVVLRGVGGRFHGRCFTLAQPRLVGRHPDADIRIDDPAFADRHARLELSGEDVVLRDLGSAEGSVVNGEVVRDAVLEPGDQLVFDGQHRFVVEAPRRKARAAERDVAPGAASGLAGQEAAPRQRDAMRLPWLLLAALGLAALLSALLLFGSG